LIDLLQDTADFHWIAAGRVGHHIVICMTLSWQLEQWWMTLAN